MRQAVKDQLLDGELAQDVPRRLELNPFVAEGDTGLSVKTSKPGSIPTVAIDLASVTKSYGNKPVVNGLSFTVAAGECFGLLGPNGAGKSTITRMILGMTTPGSGEITVLGVPVPSRARLARMGIGVVPQFDNLDIEFTVRENLLVFGRYFRMSTREIEAVIPSLLEFARLESKADARVSDLSGGMKRRLTLARALINDPQLLILDEPTTGLDPHARHLIWERLRSLLARGKTILLTTHIMEEAERLCDRLCVLEGGRKIAEGRPHVLIDEHIGCQVIEIYGGNPHELSALVSPYARHIEVSGETVFCYALDPKQVRVQLDGRAGVRFLQRPPNLEDVFLRLTGRELKD
ncbi:nodulation factor export ABC transporter ATP-binding protein NodI [Rhizobium tibeticum]|uniref:Daunorubicin/doxorubicin resistance ATP-binding protein DrrA n=1 Tax=Rhizobium tibeticum TaxID=501024 RepID=A0A1H8WM90_9HYPH|nr:nodulation factor ABC transporter ATP-binding protein NodI [Rhizobium tibeticum]SEI20624.1 Daunorubicin/doxorubicin resistance ATP-binding protein DrrA [Rhizobium tibeticum]SEP28814.1 nodulation factor export ABC transporter ATP-binding protein NodI [Rhizobium tibeticum]